MLKDFLGREIRVRDIVVYSSSSYVSLLSGVVTKINPKTIQINGSGSTHPNTVMVVTEQYGCSGKQAEADQLIRDNEGRVDESKPVIKTPSQKWAYGIFVCFDTPNQITDLSQVTVHIRKLASNNDNENSASYLQWAKANPQYVGDRNYFWSVSTNRWGGDVKLRQSSSYHMHNLRLQTVKDLGLKDFIDGVLSYADFKTITQGKLDLKGFDPMAAKQSYYR